ncbi:MAG: hydrogenase assembly protein HupF [Acidimicrobiales bacterium]
MPEPGSATTNATPTEPTDIDVADLPRVALALARRLSAGATMWCLAPAWPEHARHVAVEFVHPVIVGTRALPAVSISAPDPVAAVRAVARAGDIVLAVSATDDPVVAEVFRRAPAWGVTTVWIASGSPAPDVRADWEVLVDDPDGSAPFDGRLVLRYHLLWELTHVCFEHPGLLKDESLLDEDEVCITCRDEGRLAEVVGPTPGGVDIEVRTASGAEVVDVSLVGDVARHDLVLIHAGAAIASVAT